MTHTPETSATSLNFRKSSYSNGQENCVECAFAPLGSDAVIRDSKDPHGPALVFRAEAWRAFVADLHMGGLPSGS
ncbi:DUF397 domain-containing protein [Kitasatospora viridis]|uniref:Uncharacterized protein DUF397 n=1 Tax=Kitasatospora viridis TaxID=281105 RepID=A0A561UP73_9ACTN|nr:DUF397 domain-containing protein [Kitasatospora viridis]TWG01152.1 uncharacterized protein DUF397 [Kitasatospora viridis]